MRPAACKPATCSCRAVTPLPASGLCMPSACRQPALPVLGVPTGCQAFPSACAPNLRLACAGRKRLIRGHPAAALPEDLTPQQPSKVAEYLASLSREQREAVTCPASAVRVKAGPGSGKGTCCRQDGMGAHTCSTCVPADQPECAMCRQDSRGDCTVTVAACKARGAAPEPACYHLHQQGRRRVGGKGTCAEAQLS
jgi:hypothetical protein